MSKRIWICLFLLGAILGFIKPVISASMSASNFLANGGYEQKFSAWENDSWTLMSDAYAGKYAATATVVNGAIKTLCSKPYAATRRDVRLSVALKANAASNSQNAGRGYAEFFVRWLDAKQQRLYDTTYMMSDNAPRNVFVTRSWVNAYQGEGNEEYLQICVRAVSYAPKPFVVTVDNWTASE